MLCRSYRLYCYTLEHSSTGLLPHAKYFVRMHWLFHRRSEWDNNRPYIHHLFVNRWYNYTPYESTYNHCMEHQFMIFSVCAGCSDGFVICPNAYYNYRKHRKADYYTQKSEVQSQIMDIYHEHMGVDGYRSMTVYLARRGYHYSRTPIHKYMNNNTVLCRASEKAGLWTWQATAT